MYVPKGKVALLLGAMRAAAEPIWTAAQVAERMEIAQGNIPAYLQAVVTRGIMHRKLAGGKSYFSLQPFPEDFTPPAQPASAALDIPKFGGSKWAPPKMTPPRGATGHVPREPLPEPLHTILAPVPSPAPATLPPPAPRPTPAPTAAPLDVTWGKARRSTQIFCAPSTEPEHEEEEADAEPIEFTARRWTDGDIDLFGLEELEDGGMRLPAASVGKLLDLLGAVRC